MLSRSATAAIWVAGLVLAALFMLFGVQQTTAIYTVRTGEHVMLVGNAPQGAELFGDKQLSGSVQWTADGCLALSTSQAVVILMPPASTSLRDGSTIDFPGLRFVTAGQEIQVTGGFRTLTAGQYPADFPPDCRTGEVYAFWLSHLVSS